MTPMYLAIFIFMAEMCCDQFSLLSIITPKKRASVFLSIVTPEITTSRKIRFIESRDHCMFSYNAFVAVMLDSTPMTGHHCV